MTRAGLALVTVAVAVLGFTSRADAVPIVWNFGDDNAVFDTGTPSGFTVGAFSIGNTFGTVADPVNASSASSGYPGATGTGNIGNAVNIGALNTATSAFYTVTFTPDAGNALTISGFDFGARSTGTGPQAFSLRSDLDGFAADIITGTIANNSAWAYFDTAPFTLTGAVDQAITLRLYTFNGTGSPASSTINSRLDDITIEVSAAIPEPSTVAGLGAALVAAGVWGVRRRRRA